MKNTMPLACLVVLLSACAAQPNMKSATATLAPTTGNNASGTVTFSQQGNGVQVAGEVRGLAPNAAWPGSATCQRPSP